MPQTKCIIAAAALLALPSLTRADSVFNDNFDTDETPFWNFNSSAGAGDSAADNANNEANYHFDYSSVGIPSADGPGGTTFGLKIEANIPGTGVFEGASTSLNGLTLPSQYILHAKVWENTIGPMPGGGSGSTQLTTLSVGVTGTNSEFAGATMTGVQFSASGDGGTAQDYRAYTAQFPDGAGAQITPNLHPGVYAAGDSNPPPTGTPDSRNNSDPYYTSRFPGQAPPPDQQALFPAKQTSTAASNGTQAFKWHDWVVYKADDAVTWFIDGQPIARVDSSLFPADFASNMNIAFGQVDINATSSTDSDARSLLFGLFDDIQVESIPEPASMSFLMIGGAALLRQRRRRRLA